MPTEVERAWAAGFFDADGSTTVGGKLDRNGSMRLSCRAQLGQAEQQWGDLDRFATIVQCGRITAKGPRKDQRPGSNPQNWKPFKNWQAQSLADVAVCMNVLWPYLGEYKRQRWTDCWDKARASRTPKGAGGKRAPSHERS